MTDNFSVPPDGMQAWLGPGSRIGQYVIEQRVGSGGMAVVFSARDESLGRMVALKVLSPTLAHDEEFRRRFLRESRSVAAVEESHIVPVYGAGESNGVLYIATRFVPGGDLGTLLRSEGRPFAPARAVSVVSQIAAALDAAHRAGLVHRDVRSQSNVLIDSTPGRPSEHAYLRGLRPEQGRLVRDRPHRDRHVHGHSGLLRPRADHRQPPGQRALGPVLPWPASRSAC